MTTSDWLLLALVALVTRIVFGLAMFRAGQRHARYTMRVRLARWLYSGRLQPVTRVRKGKIIVSRRQRLSMRRAAGPRATERRKVLSVVRRDDESA